MLNELARTQRMRQNFQQAINTYTWMLRVRFALHVCAHFGFWLSVFCLWPTCVLLLVTTKRSLSLLPQLPVEDTIQSISDTVYEQRGSKSHLMPVTVLS